MGVEGRAEVGTKLHGRNQTQKVRDGDGDGDGDGDTEGMRYTKAALSTTNYNRQHTYPTTHHQTYCTVHT